MDSENLLTSIAQRPDFYGIDAHIKSRSVESAIRVLRELLDGLDQSARSMIDEKLQSALMRLGDTVFEGVNAHRARNTDFDAAFAAQWRRLSHRGSLHLELGTSTAWPDQRATDYVVSENIGDVIRLDFEISHKPDVAASATALPFQDNSIDRISSNSLFEHVAYPHEILRESFRVLRPGGVIYTAVPFHFVQHACPSDYLRFTGAFFEAVCEDIGFAEVRTDVTSTSGLYYTLHTLAKSAFVDAANEKDEIREVARGLQISVITLLALAQAFDDFTVAGGASHFHSTHCYAVKGGTYEPREQWIDRSRPFLERHQNLFACPISGEPLIQKGDQLISRDNSSAYSIDNGIPVLVVMHGRNSPLRLAKRVNQLEQQVRHLRAESMRSVHQ